MLHLHEGENYFMTLMAIAIYDDVEEDGHALKGMLAEILPQADIRVYRDYAQIIDELEKRKNPYNLVFLGVNEPEAKGLEAAQKIRELDILLPIIFVASSNKFYREAFYHYAFNYLPKPIKRDALEHVIYPLRYRLGERDEKTVRFRYRSQVYFILHKRILYISSSLHTVNFHLVDGRILRCRGKLNDFESQLENSSFLRCHQSFFVNMDKIDAMKNDSFRIGENVIPVSRSYSRIARQIYKKHLQKMGKD